MTKFEINNEIFIDREETFRDIEEEERLRKIFKNERVNWRKVRGRKRKRRKR